MLKIIVQLIPFGELPAKQIAEMSIINDGTGNEVIGNYEYKLVADDIATKGKMTGFQRRKHNVWYLVYLILDKIYGKNK